jgi:hypothetical protein
MPVSVNQIKNKKIRKPVDKPSEPIHGPYEPIHGPPPPQLLAGVKAVVWFWIIDET